MGSIMSVYTSLNKLFAIAITSVVIPRLCFAVASCAKALSSTYAFSCITILFDAALNGPRHISSNGTFNNAFVDMPEQVIGHRHH